MKLKLPLTCFGIMNRMMKCFVLQNVNPNEKPVKNEKCTTIL